MSVVLIRSLILYIVVIFGVRLMGKRQLGELQPSELVITILISNIATLPLEDTSIALILGIMPILTLVCFEALMSWVTLKSLRMRRIISGRPKIVVRDGQIEQATMRDLRLSVDDLMTALRQQQVFDISQVQFAVMETTGTISVYLKAECQPLTPADITLKKTAQNPPVAVIQDGCVMNKSLAMLGKNQAWLEQKLAEHRLTEKQVFLMLSDAEGTCTIIPKKRGDADTGAVQLRDSVAGAFGNQPPVETAGHRTANCRNPAGAGEAGICGVPKPVGKIGTPAESGGLAGQGAANRCDSFASGTHAGRGL